MKTMWHISRWGDLSPVEVVRETEKTVWTVNGRRQAKKADYNTIFDKKSDAVWWYLDRLKNKRMRLKQDLESCITEIGEYEARHKKAVEAELLDKPEK